MSEKLRTQISSKYSPGNLELFAFKRLLNEAGIFVAYPIGDDVIGYEQEFAITVPEEAERPFYSSEVMFLKNIKQNPIQVVYNINGGLDGYIGESTSIETAYAMLLNKPIVLLREPLFSSTIPTRVRELIESRVRSLPVVPLDKHDSSSVADYLSLLATKQVDYNFSTEEKALLMREIVILCRYYKESWLKYKADHGNR